MAKLGLQLYTVRDFAEKDFFGTIRKVGKMGYEGVEFAGGVMQMSSAQELKKLLSETGLKVAGAVFGLEELEAQFNEIVTYCKTIGCPAVVFPWIDEKLRTTQSGCQAVAQRCNAVGEKLLAHDIKFLYHVHGYEFVTVEGMQVMDVLMKYFDPRHVNLEIDVYWVEYAGVDSVEFMKKWGHRSPYIHFKDMKDKATKKDAEVGDGAIDMHTIARIGKLNKAEWFIVEQEQFDMPSIDSVVISLKNLKKIVQEV